MAPASSTAGRETAGYALAFFGSVGLGSAIAIARLAYEGGANGLSIAFPRAWLLVALLLLFCWLTGRSLALPRRVRLHCMGAGAVLGYLFYGNIAAAEFIEAPVAALIFFVYPPLTTVLNAVIERRAPSPARLAAAVIAFAGLALTLGAGFGDLDWRGVALGLAAGILCGVQMIWIARAMPPHDPVVTMTHMAIAAAVVLTVATIVVGGAPIPSTETAWIATAAAGIVQALSVPLFYVAIPLIGPERTAVLNNLQPLSSIVVAFLLLGEALGPLQLVGAAMILGGIFLMQAASKRGGEG